MTEHSVERPARLARLAGALRPAALPVGAALLVAWTLWLYRLGINDYDDGVSNEVIFAQSPLAKILLEPRWHDQSPLYFVLLHFWTLLGRDPLTVKSLNVLLLSVGLVLVWRIARLSRASPAVAGLTVAIAAASPLCLWMARNGRMYVPQLVLTLWSIDALLRILSRGRRRDAAELVLACALNIYNHFFGFAISALVFAVWLLESLLATRGRGAGAWRGALRAPLAAGVILGVLVAPQIQRVLALGDSPPAQASWSLPGASIASMEHVQGFWFVNASWSGLRNTLPFADELFYVSAYGLAILGVAASPARTARLTLIWFAAPLAIFGALAGHLDLRTRYLAFVAPLLWLAIARGALAPLSELQGLPASGRLRRSLRVVRTGMLAVFVACTLWLLWHKLPERYAEWTKVLTALDRVYRPDTVLYMERGPSRGIPPAIVAHTGLRPELAAPEPVEPRDRAAFLRRVSEHREFAFLIHRGRIGEEQAWMHRVLEAAGWKPIRLRGWNAEARLFRRRPSEHFALRYRLPEARVPDWIAARLTDPHRVLHPRTPLEAALVARLGPEGALRESVLYASQRGESGAWQLGDADGSAVGETTARIEDEQRSAWRVRVPPGETVVLAVPRDRAGDPRSWRWGVLHPEESDATGLDLRLLAGSRPVGGAGPQQPGWNALEIDAAALDDSPGPLSLWLSHAGADPREVYISGVGS